MNAPQKYKTVTRYVVTYINRDGMRDLIGPMQGRHTYATEKEALEMLACIKGNNSFSNITSVYGNDPQFQVRPCECYAEHFDPVGRYFD